MNSDVITIMVVVVFIFLYTITTFLTFQMLKYNKNRRK